MSAEHSKSPHGAQRHSDCLARSTRVRALCPATPRRARLVWTLALAAATCSASCGTVQRGDLLPGPEGGAEHPDLADSSAESTAPSLEAGADAGARDADAAAAIPVTPRALETRNVWQPASGRYTNEPTLLRAPDGTWHVFSNGAAGGGGPWVETQLLHGTAPSLLGPWTEQPDILTTHDPDATENALHAPYVLFDGSVYRLYYFDGTQLDDHGLHTAVSTDLFHWTRQGLLPGGRDPMILRDEGVDRLYTVGVELAADGLHDLVRYYEGANLGGFTQRAPALRNPALCPHDCWGWYESPFVVRRPEGYYLLTTNTSSLVGVPDYERTLVLYSRDPTHFEPTPLTTLSAHGAEVHEEGGELYLTHGGWPARLGDGRRGLFVTRLQW